MGLNVTGETLESFNTYFLNKDTGLIWSSLFILPSWLEVWWQTLSSGDEETCLLSVRDDDALIGLAPLMRRGGTICFLGNTDVCDYQDFIPVAGREEAFSRAFLKHISNKGLTRLSLAHIRPDSFVMKHLAGTARAAGHKVDITEDAVSMEMPLPETWDDYLGVLDRKQRHEVRRKLRRLEEEGKVEYSYAGEPGEAGELLEIYINLFGKGNSEKAAFMTEKMAGYFRDLASRMSAEGLLRMGRLSLDGATTAMILCFEYGQRVYLYNSGYDPAYRAMSVGILSKVLGIRASIEGGNLCWDFLKGSEPYKGLMGGRPVTLYRCEINI
ncbi:GNAT family N-acetyltransferase [Chloroflexota bacterium]